MVAYIVIGASGHVEILRAVQLAIGGRKSPEYAGVENSPFGEPTGREHRGRRVDRKTSCRIDHTVNPVGEYIRGQIVNQLLFQIFYKVYKLIKVYRVYKVNGANRSK